MYQKVMIDSIIVNIIICCLKQANCKSIDNPCNDVLSENVLRNFDANIVDRANNDIEYEVEANANSFIHNQNLFATDSSKITARLTQAALRSANQLKDSELFIFQSFAGDIQKRRKREEKDRKINTSDQLKKNCIKFVENNSKRLRSNSPSILKDKSAAFQETKNGPESVKRSLLAKKGSYLSDLFMQADGSSNIDVIAAESDEAVFNDVDNSSLTLTHLEIVPRFN